MALYFYFNGTTGDLVYSDKATYDVDGYTSVGEQTNMNPTISTNWVFYGKRQTIRTVTKDSSVIGKIAGLTSMGVMFYNCIKLTSLDISGFDTSQVTNMDSMFKECANLVSLDTSDFDTSQVTSMDSMFYRCASLTSLDLSGFDTSQVTNMDSMFGQCRKLTSLDLSGFNTSQVTSMDSMFYNCSNLRLFTISGNMSNVLSQLPANFRYYPASGGDPVSKADLTAGTWVRDEADLSMVTSIVEQAQMSQAISRRIGKLNRDLRAEIAKASAGSSTPSVDVVRTDAHSTSYTKDTLEIVTDSSGKVTAMYFVTVD